MQNRYNPSDCYYTVFVNDRYFWMPIAYEQNFVGIGFKNGYAQDPNVS